ncbi:MAG: ATP-binding cassette domain-containing protein [Desulfobacterales bacterium]|nr:ATP-binding cassette domain-containing protein [Desulfobacterales bacterium]
MNPAPAIQVRDLVAKYDDNLILDRISFDVRHGEIFVILGASGCGKSTLLRHLVGLNKPFSGGIIVNGVDIVACDETRFRDCLKNVGILFQSSALFGSMTVAENLALPITEYTDLPPEAIDDLVGMKLCMVGLEGFEDYFPSQISGGMKKRAGFARAMALNPEILFLDEPTSGLDPVSSAEIDELILSINQSMGATIVIVTHSLSSIFRVAGRVVMLDKHTRKIIAEGDPKYLKEHSDNPEVRRFFNSEAST